MTFPTTPSIKAIQVGSNRPVSINYTLSGKRSVRQFASQYFTFAVQMPPLTQTQLQSFSAYLISKKGAFNTFDFGYPIDNLGTDKNTSGVKTRTTHTTGATSIACDGFSASTNDVVKAGDLIKFSGHNKVYIVTGDVNSNGAGQGSISVEPPLQSDLADNEVIDLNKPVITVSLLQNDLIYSTDPTGLFNLSFELREVL